MWDSRLRCSRQAETYRALKTRFVYATAAVILTSGATHVSRHFTNITVTD